ncbi:hypothetical protein [Metabacillus fastidiosus]|uniref:hypothetical protein n=1 Tax=Metabacillus fastidiosus TaxID=1458 RepID=UPI002E1C2FB8|nr:hypothetical protein [Metabacillus fastidiosus]
MVDSRIVSVTPSIFTEGNIAGTQIRLKFQNETVTNFSEILGSTFTGDFENVKVPAFELSDLDTIITFHIGQGMVTNKTGRATLKIPGSVFSSGKDLIVNFDTTN